MICVGSGCWPAEQGMGGNPVWQRGLMTDWLNPLQLLLLLIHRASQKFNPLVRREVDNGIYLFFLKLQNMYRIMFPMVWRNQAAGHHFLAHVSILLSASTEELFFPRFQSGLTSKIRLALFGVAFSMLYPLFIMSPVFKTPVHNYSETQVPVCPHSLHPPVQISGCLPLLWAVTCNVLEWRLLFLCNGARLLSYS